MVKHENMTVRTLIELLTRLLDMGQVKPTMELWVAMDEEGNGYGTVSTDTAVSLEIIQENNCLILYPY